MVVMRSVTIIILVICCAACRTPKKVVEEYQRVDSVVMSAEHSAISVEQIIEHDTIATEIVVEQLDTLGRVTARATIIKQRKKNILTNKSDTAFLHLAAARQEQAAIHVEQTPERARAWAWVLGLIIISLIGLFWFLWLVKGR